MQSFKLSMCVTNAEFFGVCGMILLCKPLDLAGCEKGAFAVKPCCRLFAVHLIPTTSQLAAAVSRYLSGALETGCLQIWKFWIYWLFP